MRLRLRDRILARGKPCLLTLWCMPTSATTTVPHASYVVMYGDELAQITVLCTQLMRDAQAYAIALVDRNGQYITGQGAIAHIDTAALASLTAGSAAAAENLAKLIGEKAFATSDHHGECTHLHISPVGERAVVLLIFDAGPLPDRVRDLVRKFNDALCVIFATLDAKAHDASQSTLLNTISDADIDNVFGK